MLTNDTIIAMATPSGSGAIAVVRISGKGAISITAPFFRSVRGKDLNKQKSHTVHLGHILEGGRLIDEVLVSIFKGPHSYTGEDVVEISCHGSPYIIQQIIQLFLRNGCRTADAGEFTLRAFLNAKIDLSQAEAVADLIASDNEASHQVALQQMRGGFSNEIKKLRAELLDFASLIELELDFSEEDVEFADRTQFKELLVKIQSLLKGLIDSFALGNVIKNGIPVAIVGEPNVGKSTLLKAFLNEERAIVSEIPGTTRDSIEDEVNIGGIGFRFIDTAGIRETTDIVEGMGIRRTFEKIGQAAVIMFLLDAKMLQAEASNLTGELESIKSKYPDKPLIIVINKVDVVDKQIKTEFIQVQKDFDRAQIHLISAKTGFGVEDLKKRLLTFFDTGALSNNETIVTNTRHYNALSKALEEVYRVRQGIENNVSGDLLAIDIKQALYHLGEITGEITSDDLLGNIFANFCIGK